MRQSAERLVKLLREHGLKITTAESLTGGLLAAAIVSVPGASEVFEAGFVTYAAEAKMKFLSVSGETIEAKGVVSLETAREMCEGAALSANADVALSTTGNAGPDTLEGKPVGLVFTGVRVNGRSAAAKHLFTGDRDEIREQAVSACLDEAVLYLTEAFGT